MECSKAPSGVRKVKKKQVKDELDRIKQAEKKKRRLEKALAASAAIISELEKKNQKKKEEQQRLDQECAAIAEAVALQVLIGDESDKSCNNEWYPWGCCPSNFDLFVGGSDRHARTTAAIIPHPRHMVGNPIGDMGRVSDGCGGSRCPWDGYDSGYFLSDARVERGWEAAGVSDAAMIAAEAIASLQIADDGVDAFVFNQMLRG